MNNNFNYLDGRINSTNASVETVVANVNSSLINMQNFLEASISAQISALINNVSSSIENLNEFTQALDERIEELEQCQEPTKTALIDWDKMALIANTTVDALKKQINNTTTGISAYGGNHSALHYGDIYLKEDFTNYPRIMVVYTDDNGTLIQAKVWESWVLDYLLSQSKGKTSITGNNHSYDLYWNVYGYEYKQTISGVEYNSKKDFFFCNNNQNCGIVEIYGLGEKIESEGE